MVTAVVLYTTDSRFDSCTSYGSPPPNLGLKTVGKIDQVQRAGCPQHLLTGVDELVGVSPP